MKLFEQKGSLREIIVPAEKKISTPAGARLSNIMDTTRAPPVPARSILRRNNMNDIDESSTSSVLRGKSGRSYSNAWSDGGVFGKDGKMETSGSNTKRRGLGRLALIIAIIIAAIIALTLGLVFGLQKTKSNSNDSSSGSSAENNSISDSISSSASQTSSGSTSSTTTRANFPLGTYSFTTFLDTVTTECTSNEATWNCYPDNTIYNKNKKKASTTFNWIITGSEGDYKIQSSDNPLSLDFDDVDLMLVSKGQDSERYHFQFTMDKTVVPSTSITDDDSSAVCYFNSTIFTGYLYTKMEKDYPTDDESNSAWPYAVRAEQSIGGGEDVPTCYKTVDGQATDQITGGIEAGGASTLCSCLYRNYLTK